MICEVVFSFLAYNVDLHKTEHIKIVNCNDGEKIYTIPHNRGCGYQIINGKKYWYCLIIKNNKGAEK
jgi:aspartate 1-decarboxylase